MSRRKSTTVEEELPDAAPPQDWAPESGTVEVWRDDPPGGFLCELPPEEARAPVIQEAYGGGTFRLVWNPPPDSDAKPRTKRITITGTPRDLDAVGNRGGREGGAVGALLSRITALEVENQKRQNAEWQRLLDLTRTQSKEGLDSVVAVIQANSDRLLATMEANAKSERERLSLYSERERERAREDRDREQARMDREREIERARLEQERDRDRQFYTALTTLHSVNSPAAEGDEIERMQKLATLAQSLGGGWVGSLINAAPGLMAGASDAFVNVASAAAMHRQQRPRAEKTDGTPAEALPEPTGAGFEGGNGQAPPADASAGAGGDGSPEERELTDDELALLGWLDWLRTVPIERWRQIIPSQLTAGVLPSILVEPIKEAAAGKTEALQTLLIQAESEDIWQAVVDSGVLGGKPSAAGKPGEVGSAGGPGRPVAVAGGAVDPES